MGKTKAITDWLMQCPELCALWNISAEETDGANVILPSGTSYRRNIDDRIDITGVYEADITPLPSVYEEFQINCYKAFTNNNNEYNVMNFEDVEKVIEWIQSMDEAQSFPDIDGKKVVAVDCFPFQPQIRAINSEGNIVCYYVTLRITYVNTARGRSVGWEM